MAFEIVPSTQTWQHNTYVSIGLDLDADGSITVYKSSGSGTANNMKVCYPQSDTFSQASVITAIDIPQSAGTHTLTITVWWDNQSGENQDHNNHTITFEVTGAADISVSKVVLANGTILMDLTADTVDAAHLADGFTAHDKSGAAIVGTMSGGGGGDITVEPLTVTENGVYTAPEGKAYSPVTVNVPVQPGGDSIGTATVTPTANATSVTIRNLLGTPKWFFLIPNASTTITGTASTRKVTSHVYDGTSDRGQNLYGSGSSWSTSYTVTTNSTNFSHTYSNGTLTLNSGGASYGGYYQNVAHTLVYGY